VSEIVLSRVSKTFPGGVKAIDGISLTIENGEFMVLVGPSGCGKTTLLRMIAGLETVNDGSIRLGDRDITNLEPRDRDIAMVFQDYALYPHMNVRDNLSYGLRVRKTPKHEIERRVDEVAELLGLQELLDRLPAALSGGQRQRVAMGRAIARRPQVYLMDEPLSNLDAKLRVRVRADLARLHAQLGVTTVYVTHDQVEAMQLGQRSAVMRDGRIQQVGRPQTLYRDSANLFVASFIGSPSMNLVRAELEGEAVRFAGYRVPLDLRRRPPGASAGQVILGIRPEDFEDARFSPGLPMIGVEIALVEDLGPEALAFFALDAERVEPEIFGVAADRRDQEALMADDRRALFSATLDAATGARAGTDLPPHCQPRALPLLQPVQRREPARHRGSRATRRGRLRITRIPILLVGAAVFVGPIVLGLGHLTHVAWGMALVNSLTIAISFTVLSTASAALAGFAFARHRVWWKNVVFLFVLSTLMVPWIVTMIPQFVIFYRLHLINTPWPWVLWGIQGTPLQIFLFRQFYASFPRELEDAAAIDGSGRLRIFWDIFVPNSKPIIAVTAVWGFILVWGDYLTQDLFFLLDPNGTLLTRITDVLPSTTQTFPTLPLALYALPPIVFFLFVQRYITQSVVRTGIKG
jgi:multiple sugar transport system ATP-binding protein